MGWDRLIQPLDAGTYDVAAFVQIVRAAGYRGPFGFQGYGIKAAPREVLERTMKKWREIGSLEKLKERIPGRRISQSHTPAHPSFHPEPAVGADPPHEEKAHDQKTRRPAECGGMSWLSSRVP